MEFIRDGKGRGFLASVNDENRLDVECVTMTMAYHINHLNKKYYTLTINTTATLANDCIGYLKNDDTEDLIIDSIYLYSADATLLTINGRETEGVIAGTTDITPVNCNLGSGLLAQVTAYQGTDITGLTGGEAVLNWFAPAGDPRLLNFHPGIIIPKNSFVSFWASQSASAVIIGLGMHFHG